MLTLTTNEKYELNDCLKQQNSKVQVQSMTLKLKSGRNVILTKFDDAYYATQINNQSCKLSLNIYPVNHTCQTIMPKSYENIVKTYQNVDQDNYPDNDDWHIIVCAGADQKYCRYCISDKLKMIRNLNFDEFYGDGVVD